MSKKEKIMGVKRFIIILKLRKALNWFVRLVVNKGWLPCSHKFFNKNEAWSESRGREGQSWHI
tara:strand:- start:768 stop:956 length:189 start_codon:yes stop_codon:yes gene_type:complete